MRASLFSLHQSVQIDLARSASFGHQQLTRRVIVDLVSATTKALEVPELVCAILEHLDRQADLVRTALVSRDWRAWSERVLYASPAPYYPGGATEAVSMLVRTISDRVDLAQRVRRLDLYPCNPCGPGRPTENDLCLQVISRTANLVDLTFDSESRATE